MTRAFATPDADRTSCVGRFHPPVGPQVTGWAGWCLRVAGASGVRLTGALHQMVSPREVAFGLRWTGRTPDGRRACPHS
jgi:hypothetical protein